MKNHMKKGFLLLFSLSSSLCKCRMLWFYTQYLLKILPTLLTQANTQYQIRLQHTLKRAGIAARIGSFEDICVFVDVYMLISLLPMESWVCSAGRRPCPPQDTESTSPGLCFCHGYPSQTLPWLCSLSMVTQKPFKCCLISADTLFQWSFPFLIQSTVGLSWICGSSLDFWESCASFMTVNAIFDRCLGPDT